MFNGQFILDIGDVMEQLEIKINNMSFWKNRQRNLPRILKVKVKPAGMCDDRWALSTRAGWAMAKWDRQDYFAAGQVKWQKIRSNRLFLHTFKETCPSG